MRRSSVSISKVSLIAIFAMGIAACSPSGLTSPAGSVSVRVSPSESAAATGTPEAIPSPLPSLPPGARISSRIQVGDPVAPRWLAADATSLWVHEPTGIVRVNMSNGAILGRVPTDSISYGYLAVGEGAVWQADYDRNTLLRIDPRTSRVVASIAVGSSPEGVAVTPGAIWVANHNDGTVSRIDPSTNRVVATIQVGPNGSNGPLKMAADQTSVWVDVPNLDSVVRIDPATNRVALTVPDDGPVATDGTEVWVFGDQFTPEALRIDPSSGAVLATVPVPSLDRGDIAIGLGSVWLTSSSGLIRIDTKSESVVGELVCDGGDVAVGGAAVWVSAEGQPYVLKIAPL